tara:strand:- start:967 stop:1326 length:360 start_codon:yes stop_codon:yes gene_type:complete
VSYVPSLTSDEILFLRSLKNTLVGSTGPNQYVPKLSQLKKAVGVFHGLTMEQLEGPCRAKPFVKARIDYAHLAMKHCSEKVTLTMIGKSINKDHTSIMHYLNNHQPGDLATIEKMFDVK